MEEYDNTVASLLEYVASATDLQVRPLVSRLVLYSTTNKYLVSTIRREKSRLQI